MAYLAPIHRPSSIRHAIKLNFLMPEEECLIVAKSNRLEIYVQTEDGLMLQHSKAIYGKVTMLHKLRPEISPTDHLFVGTDRFAYFTLSWDATEKQLKTEKTCVDLADKTLRDTQTGDRCLMDPLGRFLSLELYEGVITVIPIGHRLKNGKLSGSELGQLQEAIPSRISELFVKSSAFLQRPTDKPLLALLHDDSHSRMRLKVRILHYTVGKDEDSGSVELDDANSPSVELEPGASHLIPLQEPAYGLLILGETSIAHYNDATGEIMSEPLDEATIWVTWEQIDPSRFILTDDYGRLYMLMLLTDHNGDVDRWELELLGATSRASTLVYLDGGRVFVGSHQGDSQVVQIQEPSRDKPDPSLKVVQTFANVAPILDFTIMDLGNRSGEGQANEFSSGQARIVTGSGAYNDGSLRSVRSGVGLEDLGILGEMENAINMFGLACGSADGYVDTLLVAFVEDTRVFRFSSDGDVEEVDDSSGFSTSEQTLLAAELSDSKALQITTASVRILEPDSGVVSTTWEPSRGQTITAAEYNGSNAMISVGGRLVQILEVGDEVRVLSTKEFDQNNQVACIAISSCVPAICLVGFWQTSEIAVLSIDMLNEIQRISVAGDEVSIPRSLLITTLFADRLPTLFIAMADGTVVTYSIDPKTYALSERKSIILGTQQASFRAIARGEGIHSVFTICEHSSLIYGDEGRIVYSAVTAEKATCVCPFDSEAYPGAIAIASSEDLRIALVDTERTTHVQTLPVNETVRRIAYSPALKSFGLGTIKRTLSDGVEKIESHFKLVDEVQFKQLDTYPLSFDEELVESVMRAELSDGTGSVAERFVVGTAYVDEERIDNVKGRMIVFEVTEDRKLKLVTQTALRGACRSLGMVDGNIVAGLVKTVVVYSFSYETPSKPLLTKKASYRTSTAPIDLHVSGNLIAIADLMKSVSIVQYTRREDGVADRLEEVARHYQTAWGTAVAEVAENMWLESDAEGNLMVLSRDTTLVTEDDRKRLNITSEMLLGEMVNRIRRIDVQSTPNSVVIPKAFVATVEGSIYLFALISPSKQNLLMRLQANLAEHVRTPGHNPGKNDKGVVPFNKYRAFKNQVREEDEPRRFVDGELIEKFLDCSPEVQQSVVTDLANLGVDVEEVKSMVEQLRRQLCGIGTFEPAQAPDVALDEPDVGIEEDMSVVMQKRMKWWMQRDMNLATEADPADDWMDLLGDAEDGVLYAGEVESGNSSETDGPEDLMDFTGSLIDASRPTECILPFRLAQRNGLL